MKILTANLDNETVYRLLAVPWHSATTVTNFSPVSYWCIKWLSMKLDVFCVTVAEKTRSSLKPRLCFDQESK